MSVATRMLFGVHARRTPRGGRAHDANQRFALAPAAAFVAGRGSEPHHGPRARRCLVAPRGGAVNPAGSHKCERLSWRHVRILHPHPRGRCARQHGLDARGQVRRLPAPAGARWRPRAADYARRLQLDKPLSVDCGGRAEEPAKRLAIDGEAVILGVDGILDFNARHSGRHNEEVQLCASVRRRRPTAAAAASA